MRHACLSLSDPEPLSLFDHVYQDEHALLTEERAWFAEYHAGFADAAEHTAAADGGAR